MENHGQRPEVVQARASGIGKAQRHSDTLNIDMLYVAVPVQHPAVAFVRVALPLTDVRQQLRSRSTVTLHGARPGARRRRAHCLDRSRPDWSPRAGRRRHRPPLSRAATSRRRASISATTSSGPSRGRWTIRCRRSAAGWPSWRAIAGAWKRSSPAWSKASSSSIRRGGCSWPTMRPQRMLKLDERGDRTALRRDDPSSRPSRSWWPRRSAGARRSRCSCRRRAIRRARSSPARAAATGGPPTAPSWCCTTSRTCAARIRSAATSSPTSRTSCGRR